MPLARVIAPSRHSIVVNSESENEIIAEVRRMIEWIDTPDDFIALKRDRSSWKILSQILPVAVTLTVSTWVGVKMLNVHPAAPLAAAAPPAAPEATVALNPYGELRDPREPPPVSLAQNFPLKSDLESVPPAVSVASVEPQNTPLVPRPAVPQFAESAPLPAPRPAELGPPETHAPFGMQGRRLAQQNARTAVPSAAPDNRTFFEKLFGAPKLPGPVLAYAAPEDGAVSNTRSALSNPVSRYDGGTAVYDIAAHTVYLPNGTRLEAHSGLGNRLDDPRFVSERMRGPTPPNVYELRPREQLFHGVPALRLIPVGNGELYGRTGLLAHTFMLGPNGDSNGCVSFRNYYAFLQAYRNGEIKRLVVVSHLN